MFLSMDVLDGMGFRRLKAAFHSAHVYDIRGLIIEAGSVIRFSGVVEGSAYTVGVGNSVNQLFRDIVGDDLTEDGA